MRFLETLTKWEIHRLSGIGQAERGSYCVIWLMLRSKTKPRQVGSRTVVIQGTESSWRRWKRQPRAGDQLSSSEVGRNIMVASVKRVVRDSKN